MTPAEQPTVAFPPNQKDQNAMYFRGNLLSRGDFDIEAKVKRRHLSILSAFRSFVMDITRN